ncbi:hypothetical protein V1264_024355 [Littorina saxatilis]|uniref:EB domain-containing protein n=1 Tax=Littorina saxatilis TaxID=31220 RepID=A0AAN9ALF8_9CAEN
MRCNSNLNKCQCNSWHIETRLKACAKKEGSPCNRPNYYPCADNMRCVSLRCVCEDGFSPTAQRSCGM